MDSELPRRCYQAFGCDHEHFQRSWGLFQNEWFNLLISSHNTMRFLGYTNYKRWGLVWGSRSLGICPGGGSILSWHLSICPLFCLPSNYHDTNCSAPPCPSCHGALVALKLCGTPTTVSKFSSLVKQNYKNWPVYQAQDWGESSENCQDEEQLILSHQDFCS